MTNPDSATTPPPAEALQIPQAHKFTTDAGTTVTAINTGARPQPAATSCADHLAAVRPFAEYYGYTEIYESGPCDGKLVIFADAEHANDYLNGPGVLGTWIEVTFNSNGEVDHAYLKVDNACVDQVARDQGAPSQRLVRTAHLFIENPASR